MLWTDKAKKILKKYWNIDNLKDKQYEVINHLLLGNDVIGLLPTGYGKSMCYLIPPLVTKKVIFIISPLISLMDDQKEKLIKMNIPCATLHGNNMNKDNEIEQIMEGIIKIVYMSPEYLIKSDGLQLAENLIESGKLGYFAIDEGHCVSSWGHDFRPEYAKINIFRQKFPEIPILAITATATDNVCTDISKVLNLNNPKLIVASFDRPNLYLKIDFPQNDKKKKKITKDVKILPYIEKYPNDKIIIYTNSRDDTEKISLALNKLKNNCSEAYHAGLNKDVREEIQTRFITGITNVIVSTIAFGMGIDQIVRCVLIFGAPSSIEEYYQQIGRGGRDGLPCETVLFFDYSKIVIGRHFLKDIKNPILYRVKKNNLDNVSKFAFIQTCRRKYILEYFSEQCNFFTCKKCDNCIEQKLVDMTDIIYKIPIKSLNENKNKYFNDIIDCDTFDNIIKWRKYINNFTREQINDNMKLLLPSKIIKNVKELNVDDMITHFEKFCV